MSGYDWHTVVRDHGLRWARALAAAGLVESPEKPGDASEPVDARPMWRSFLPRTKQN
jgi:hypothetical protein